MRRGRHQAFLALWGVRLELTWWLPSGSSWTSRAVPMKWRHTDDAMAPCNGGVRSEVLSRSGPIVARQSDRGSDPMRRIRQLCLGVRPGLHSRRAEPGCWPGGRLRL